MSTAKFDQSSNLLLDEKMANRFKEITEGKVAWDDEGDHSITADAMRLVMRERYLDIESLSEEGLKRFWSCHRGLTRHCFSGIGGFSIRFTAQYNLFSGTICALGTPDQIEWLKASHDKGELGCFMLTEQGAGVLSGLVVEATATYDKSRKGFTLNTATDDSKKVWISQGLVADHGIFMANLLIDGKNHGPHGFLVDMKTPGITLTNMAKKTAFNTLDNAEAVFSDVFLPQSQLLRKHAWIDESGGYRYHGEKPPTFIKIGQRLLSGRLCIADAAVEYFLQCFEKTKKYTESRLINTGGDQKVPIAKLKYVEQAFESLGSVARVNSLCLQLLEHDFAKVVVEGSGDFDRNLQIAINAIKVEGVDHSTIALSKLRCKVGSYGLYDSSPFGSTNDILYCMRFAEGDAHVLQQTITRETIKPYMTPVGFLKLVLFVAFGMMLSPVLSPALRLRHHLNRHVLSLLVFLKINTPAHGKLGAWYRAGDLVYKVAKVASLRIIYNTVTSRTAKSRDTDVYLREALKECAAL